METAMQRNAASQVEQQVVIIRHTPRSRPRSPRRSPWQGPLPRGVERIVKRGALSQLPRNLYANWASSFALLTDKFMSEIMKVSANRVSRPLEWTCYKWADCCSCKV